MWKNKMPNDFYLLFFRFKVEANLRFCIVLWNCKFYFLTKERLTKQILLSLGRIILIMNDFSIGINRLLPVKNKSKWKK